MNVKAMFKYRLSHHVVSVVLPTLIAMMPTSESLGAQTTATATTQGQVTFTKDVAPILQRSCQNCHRPDSMAPMSLLTYEDARPWAKAIKENVVRRNMPPWHIDPNVGIREFKNSRALSDEEIEAIVKWVDGGAPRGNPADMPPPRQFQDSDKWNIGTPDLVLQLPQDFVVPAKAPDAWPNIDVDSGLTEDRYIQAVELKPTKGFKVVHHMGANLIYPDGTDTFLEADGVGGNGHSFEEGSGRLMKAGSKLRFGLHLHAINQEMKTNVALAIKFYPKGYVPKHVAFTEVMGDALDLDFPPNTDNVRADGYATLTKPTRIMAYQPHMHTRGKIMCMEAIYPDGRTDRVQTLNCANFNFNWHVVYEYATDVQPLLPAGTVLHIVSWHDNSANKPSNPDPDNWIGYGPRTIDDMSHAWITYYNLSDEEFKQAVQERKALEQTKAKDKAKAKVVLSDKVDDSSIRTAAQQ